MVGWLRESKTALLIGPTTPEGWAQRGCHREGHLGFPQCGKLRFLPWQPHAPRMSAPGNKADASWPFMTLPRKSYGVISTIVYGSKKSQGHPVAKEDNVELSGEGSSVRESVGMP